MNARTLPATRQTRAQWFRALSEFLPAPYVRAYRGRLNDLRALGSTPRCAWIYARAFMFAPDMGE